MVSDFMQSSVQQTDELCFSLKLSTVGVIIVIGLHLKLETVTLHLKVFTYLENPEEWYPRQ